MHSTLAATIAFVLMGTGQNGASPEQIITPVPIHSGVVQGQVLPHAPITHGEGIYEEQDFAQIMLPQPLPPGILSPKTCGWQHHDGTCGHHKVTDPFSCRNFWCAPANQVPHYAYHPAMHGNICMEPYNVTRVGLIQSFTASYGGDASNPFDHRLLDEVYDKWVEENPDEVYDNEIDADKDPIDLTPDENADEVDDDLTPIFPQESP